QLADDLGDIPRDLARAAPVAIPAVDDDHALRLRERLADAPGNIRKDAHDHLDDGGFIVLLEAFGFLVHRLGLGAALGFDDGGFGQPARLVGLRFGQAGGFRDFRVGEPGLLGGRGRAGGFGLELEFFGVGQRLDPVALRVRRLLHQGFEFALFAQDLLLLEFDLFLFLHDVDLDLLGFHQLAGFVLLQIVGQIGFGLPQVHGGLVLGDVGLVVPLGLRDLGVGLELGFLAGLLGQGAADHGVAVGFGLGDLGVAFDL